jgi:hypothetical protein
VANLPADFDVCNLPERMNARVGSAGALHLNLAMKNSVDGLAQLAHHGARVLLLLPSAVSRAVVLKKKF